MSPKIFSSSAPGTPQAALGGMITPASACRSRTCSAVRSGFCMAIFSVEQVGEALLDAVGDVERQRLDGRSRIDAAGGHPDAARDCEEIFHVMAAAPTPERSGSVPIRAVPSRCQPPFRIGLSTQILLAPAAARTSLARAMPWSIIFMLLALMV